jgi:hypothetical protein
MFPLGNFFLQWHDHVLAYQSKKTYWLEICNLDEVLDDNIQLDI